jgi:hypothetical protein
VRFFPRRTVDAVAAELLLWGFRSGGCAAACVESVTVSGAESSLQAARMGTYTKLANVMQGDRPVYQLVGSTVAYLFYSPSVSSWLIGSSYTSSSAGVASTGSSGAACPDQATGWVVATGSGWVSTYPITVAQTPPTTAAPTTVGKRSRCVCMRSAWGCSGSTGAHPRPRPSAS